MTFYRLLVVGAIAVATGTGTSLSAQAVARIDDAPHCAAAVRKAETAQHDLETLWALRSCPTAGPAVLAAVWKQPPSAPAEFNQLLRSSGHFRDGRILRAVLDVSEDRQRSLRDRVGALAVMMEFVDPRYYSRFRPRDLDSLPSAVRVSHWRRSQGRVPVDEGDLARIRTVAAHIEATETEEGLVVMASSIRMAEPPK